MCFFFSRYRLSNGQPISIFPDQSYFTCGLAYPNHLDVSISKSRGVLFEDLETVKFEPRYTVSYTDKLH